MTQEINPLLETDRLPAFSEIGPEHVQPAVAAVLKDNRQRIKELESVLGLADVIDVSSLSGAVKFGAHVELADEDTDEEKSFQIVGEYEADIDRGLLNLKSPLARALIGKEVGDSVEVRTPGGVRSYEILAIKYQ